MRIQLLILIVFAIGTKDGIAQFKDITVLAGVRHAHVDETLMGGGAAFLDYNNDGWLDIYMTGGKQTDKLYKNLRGHTFEDVSWDLPHNYGKTTNTSTVMVGDLNNDGCTDIFITTYDPDHPTLFFKILVRMDLLMFLNLLE